MNHEYRAFPKGRPAVQYADSLLWGQTGTVAARQWTVFPDAWTLNYTMTGTDNIYVRERRADSGINKCSHEDLSFFALGRCRGLLG